MNQLQWNRISELFDRAIDLPGPERESFVLSESGGDPVVLHKLLAMLDADRLLANWSAPRSFLEPFNFPDDALESFLPSPPPFQIGELIRDRFRIVRPIGEGGMGHVFEAWDHELDIRVALKAIRPELSAHPESLARFRREVRVALLANHPNICRTFQIDRETRAAGPANGVTQTIYFFTMEFIEGETLAARIARAAPPHSAQSTNLAGSTSPPSSPALPLEETLTIARQIAAALDCAHDLGVVHRDIKPANIMLVAILPSSPPSSRTTLSGVTPPTRAVVTDFGLAHLDPILASPEATALSRSGFAPGTLAYMAPEQIDGEPVSPATDIYAFGLILYEVVTGQRAYRPGVSRPPARTVVPELPPQWDQTIERCLDPDPQKRFARASEAVKALTEASTQIAPRKELRSNSILPGRIAHFVTPLHRSIIVIGIVAVVMALFAVALRSYLQGKVNPAVDPGALVYLAPIKNETGEKTMDNLTELIQAGLTQSAHINLVDQGRAGDILQQMTKPPDTVIDPPTAREIALRAGAVRVILPTVNKSGNTYNLKLELQQPDTNSPKSYRHSWSNTWTWQSPKTKQPQTQPEMQIPEELLTQIRDATDWTRQKVGESANDIARLNAPVANVTTDSWEALREFANGQAQDLRGQRTEAVVSLQSAVKADPHFALAYAKLGDVLTSLDRKQESYVAYQRALSLDLERRLTRKERDMVKGAYATDTWDYPAAEAAFRDYTAYYENDFLGWFYLAYPLSMLGRSEEAIEVLKKVHQFEPGAAAGELCFNSILLGRLDEAHKLVDELVKYGDSDKAKYYQVSLAHLEHRDAAAMEIAAQLRTAKDMYYRSSGPALQARLAAEAGQPQDALRFLDEGIADDRGQGYVTASASKQMDKAYLLCGLKSYGTCLASMTEALTTDASPPMLIAATSILGTAIPDAPRTQAVKLRGKLLQIEKLRASEDVGAVSNIAKLRLRGEGLLAEGLTQAAVAEFRKAAAQDAPIRPREYLARALTQASSQLSQPRTRSDLRREALAEYARIAQNPNLVWADPMLHGPGFVREQKAAADTLLSTRDGFSRP
jgi:serine/threonine protein kinase/tetratricopeptide (TPR) repeat protein